MSDKRTVRTRHLLRFGVLAFLLVPRIYTLLRSLVWVEDESYLYCAFLIVKGRLPYHDFPLQHFPFLETLLSIWFLFTGISVRSAEIATQFLVFLIAISLFVFARRVTQDTVTAFGAAAICSVAPIVLNYHVFGREYFVVFFVLTAAILSLDEQATHRKTILSGVLLSLATLSKLTAIAFVLSHLIFLLARRRTKEALVTGVTVFIVLTVSTAACFLLYGRSFLVQVVLFGMVHPVMQSGEKWRFFYNAVPFLLPLSLAGIAFELFRGRIQTLLLPLLHAVAGFVFIVLLKPIIWGHNAIEIVPWLALFAGSLLSSTVGAIAGLWQGGWEKQRLAAALAIGALAFGWFARTPAPDDKFIRRSDLVKIAAYYKQNTGATDVLAVPEIFALESNRLVATPYIEIAGNMRLLEYGVSQVGFWETLRRSRKQGPEWMHVSVDRSIRLSMNHVIDFIRKRQLKAVMTFTEKTPVTTVRISERFLADSGYWMAFEKGPYRIWMLRSY